MTIVEYNDKVMDYLEYLGYPDYIMTYEPEDIARTLNRTITLFYLGNISWRIAAITNFALTIEKIKRMTEKEVKN